MLESVKNATPDASRDATAWYSICAEEMYILGRYISGYLEKGIHPMIGARAF